VNQKSEAALDTWINREALAETMIPLIGRLYRENNVVTSIHGRSLINQSVVGILKAHRFARQIDEVELPLEETFPVLQALTELDLGAGSVDLARLLAKFKTEAAGSELKDFLREELAEIVGKRGADARVSTDVVLYGFGRIGRLLARIMIGHSGGGHGLRLRAIVVRKGSENDLPSARVCCAATPSTARSRGQSRWTRNRTPSSPTAR
jgi:glyceraldehyde 3-phosphate dehydrogenase